MSRPETQEQPKDQIIVAEDSAPNRKILAHLLQKMGFEVIACENGEEAWKAFSGGEHQRIVAILSDMMMPVMDGLTLLKTVRESAQGKSIPIVLITAVSDKDLILQAKNLSVNGYILKPVTSQRVESKMKELFPSRTFPKLVA
jgi:two-component system chemotaxis response regulator CheY